MADEISGEVKLLHDQFMTASKETTGQITALGQRFDAVFKQVGVSSDAGISAVVAQLAKLDAKFAKTVADSGRLANSLKFDKLAEGLQGIGDKAGVAFAGAIDGGQKYEAAINRVRAISGLGGADIQQLNKDIEDLGRKFGFAVGPTQTAEIALQALGSGFETVAESTTIAKQSLMLIADGTTNATDGTKLLVGTLNAYGMGADSAAKITSELFRIQNRGVVTISQMSQSLGLVTAAANAAGVSTAELGAAIIVATKRNLPFTSTVDGIRGLLEKLQNPTAEGSKAMLKYGLAINYATLRQKGLGGTLKEIKAAVGDDAAALKDITGDQQAFALATVLTSDGLKQFSAEVKGQVASVDDATKSTAILSEGLENRTAAFAAATERLKVSVTKDVLPLATAFVKFSTGVVDSISAIPAPIKNLGLLLTGLAGALGAVAGTGLAIKGTLALFGVEAIGAGAALKMTLSLLTKEYSATAVGAALATKATKAFAAESSVAAGAQGAGALSGALKTLAVTAGSLGALTLMGAIVIKMASDYASARDDVARFNDELVTTGEHFTNIKSGFNTGNLLGKTGKELDDAQVTLETIDKAIKKQRDALEQETVVLPTGQPNMLPGPANIPGPAGYVVGAAALVQPFFEDTQVTNTPLAKDDPKRLIIESRIKELQQEREELMKVQKARELSDAAAAKVTPFDKTSVKADFLDKKSEIDNSEDAHKRKLELLGQLRDANFKLLSEDRDLNRELNADIARQQKDANKDAADYAKRDRAEKAKQAIQDIENSKKTSDQKAADLKTLATKYADLADVRRSIEDKVLAYEKKAQAEREKIAAHQKKIALDASSERIKVAEHELEQLRKLQEKGVDTTPDQVQRLKVKAGAEKDKIDTNLQADLAKDKDPTNQADLKSNAARDKADIERASQDAITEANDKGNQDRLQREQQTTQREIEMSQHRSEQLAKYSGPGQGTFLLQAEAARRITLMIQEIELQKQLTQAQTMDPAAIAQAETLAQQQILDARIKVREEIDATTAAIEEQQKKSRPRGSNEMTGNILSMDQFLQGEKDRFTTRTADEFFGAPRKKGSTISGLSDFDIRQDILAEANRDPSRRGAAGAADSATGFAGKGAIPVAISGTFRLVDSSGKEAGRLERLTVNGRNSDLSSETRSMGL